MHALFPTGKLIFHRVIAIDLPTLCDCKQWAIWPS